MSEQKQWLKQSAGEPLFKDLLWSRPENKRHAGKLLIVGGHAHSFSAPSNAYAAALEAGIGTARVALPAALEKMLSKVFPEAEFAPSTPSGSFARTALGPICDAAAWADGVLLAGDFGRNSETAVLLESFIKKYSGLLILASDSLDYFTTQPNDLLNRSSTILVAGLPQLQKIVSRRTLIKQSMDLVQLIEALSDLTAETPVSIITAHAEQLIAATGGQVSTTLGIQSDLIKLAAYASVWALQQPNQPFEALTCAAYCL